MKETKQALSLVFRDGENVFIVRRSEDKKSFPGFWSIPSTHIHKGESKEDAANRLGAKKLGISNIKLQEKPIGVSEVVERESDMLQMTDVLVTSYEGALTLNPEEYTEYTWVNPEELKNLLEEESGDEMGECTRVFLKSEGL